MPRGVRKDTTGDPVADLERLKKSLGDQHDRLAALLPKLEGGLKQAVQEVLTSGEAIGKALQALDIAGTAQDQRDLLAIASRHADARQAPDRPKAGQQAAPQAPRPQQAPSGPLKP